MSNEAELYCYFTSHMAQAKCAHVSSQELLNRLVIQRDSDAFSALTQRHGPEVYRWCFYFLRNKTDAEDLFQEVFVALWLKGSNVRDANKLDAWLFRIVRNRALNRLKTRKRTVSFDTIEPVSSKSHEASQVAISHEQLEIVFRELGQLRTEYQEALLLTKVRGLSIQEAAEAMGRPVGTVSTFVNRGLEMLVQRLKRHQIEFSIPILATGFASECQALSNHLLNRTQSSVTVCSACWGGMLKVMPISHTVSLAVKTCSLLGLITLFGVAWWHFSKDHATVPPTFSPVAPLVKVHQLNRQYLIDNAIPRIETEFRKLVSKEGSVRVVELTELPGPRFRVEFELIGMLGLKIKGKYLVSRLRWYYYQPNGGVRAESDYFDEGKWIGININKPIMMHDPWWGKEIFSWSFTPYIKAVQILQELQIEHPPFIHPTVADEVAQDPRWRTIRRIVGTWDLRTLIYINEVKKVIKVEPDGLEDETAGLILEEGEYQLYGYPQKMSLSEDGMTLKGRLWGEWKKTQ